MTPACGQPVSRKYPANAAAAAPVAGSSSTPPAANALRTWNNCGFSAVTSAIVIKPARSISSRPRSNAYCIALFQSQDDMVGTAVNLRGRNFQVEIVDRVVEKLQQIRL